MAVGGGGGSCTWVSYPLSPMHTRVDTHVCMWCIRIWCVYMFICTCIILHTSCVFVFSHVSARGRSISHGVTTMCPQEANLACPSLFRCVADPPPTHTPSHTHLTLTHFSLPHRSLEETPLVWVDTEAGLRAMVEELSKEREVAIDLENHSYRCVYSSGYVMP